MIGIFDSGVGGFNSYYEIRKTLPLSDIIYLADRANAPYGTKSEEELIQLVKNDIRLLKILGASRILIACCTASTVYQELDSEEKALSIPIVALTAKEATARQENEKSPNPHTKPDSKKIAVIATEHTARSSAFSKAIKELDSGTVVDEFPEQRLVRLVENGLRDNNLTTEGKKHIFTIAERIKAGEYNTLVLGCTHFSHLEKSFRNLLPKVKILNPALIGAREMVNILKEENSVLENGKCIFTEQNLFK